MHQNLLLPYKIPQQQKLLFLVLCTSLIGRLSHLIILWYYAPVTFTYLNFWYYAP